MNRTDISVATATFLLFSGQLHANSAPVLDVQDQVVDLGSELRFLVAPTDADGVVPSVFMRSGPDGATLSDNTDGTRTFAWRPTKQGEYTVKFIVQDGQNTDLANLFSSRISVVGSNTANVATNSQVESSAADPSTQSSSRPSDQSIFLNGEVGAVTKILTDLPVSTSQTNVQQSPIDSSGRYLYTANIEPGSKGDSKRNPLRTVLRQGHQRSDNTWEWKNITIDDRTLHDRWHTAPSVAVDKAGQIHVAYNMHNFPWQYKRSDRAHDITSMVFKGQQITNAELKLAHEQNRTRFPTLGSAAIPGNQITYPAFYKDKNEDLYVSYRFAAAPKRKFSERTMSTGIAVYDTNNRAWSSIGAKHNPSSGDFNKDAASPDAARPFAGKKGWTSYLPKVVFSKQNNMIVSMLWRNGTAGRQVTMPCVVRSISRNDVVDMKGGSMSMPIQPERCGNIGVNNNKSFYSIGSFAIDNEDNPHLLLSPTEGSRFISRYSAVQQRWIKEKAPEGATEIFFDNDNNMYAITSGIKIFKRTSVNAGWETIYTDKSAKNCYPKVKLDASGKNAFIHAQSCDEKHISIYGLRLP